MFLRRYRRTKACKVHTYFALVESVRLFGVLQRIHVRAEGDTYQLIDGERCLRLSL